MCNIPARPLPYRLRGGVGEEQHDGGVGYCESGGGNPGRMPIGTPKALHLISRASRPIELLNHHTPACVNLQELFSALNITHESWVVGCRMGLGCWMTWLLFPEVRENGRNK